jgi:hypothetical protein
MAVEHILYIREVYSEYFRFVKHYLPVKKPWVELNRLFVWMGVVILMEK